MNETEASSVPSLLPAAEPAAARERESGAGERRLHFGVGPRTLALCVALVSLLVPLGWSGLWAPYELETAELSRRLAVALHGAAQLALPDANNAVPTLSELGRGQLPFSSVALGFQCFGLGDWAGRLPLALWGLAGIAATFVLVSRLSDRVAAAYASIALATMPLFFLQARTMLGDIVLLSAVALASGGLLLSTFHPSVARRRPRIGWGVLALAGLGAGFASRGVLFGIACPALGVGLAWLIWRAGGRRCPGRYAEAVGAGSLALGAVALGLGLWVLFLGSPELYLEVLGARLSEPSQLPTHDAVLHQLGFGLFPWSAVAPFALAVALGPESEQGLDGALRICLGSVFAVALAVHGLSAPHLGALPFAGTFAVAGLIGVAFRDAETRQRGTRLVALGAAALLIVFLFDLRSGPKQSLWAFVVGDATFPESFAKAAKRWFEYGTLGCVAVVALALGELPRGTPVPPHAEQSDYARWLKALGERWHGRLAWVLLGLTLLLGVFPVLRWLESRGVNIPVIHALGAWSRPLGYAFLIIPTVVGAPLVAWSLRDLASLLLGWVPFSGARLAVLGFGGFGLVLSLGYYPALAAQLSPRDTFESFRQRTQPGEALAVLGQASRVAPYYARTSVHTPTSARAAFDWLLEAPQQRRWLVLGARDLAQLNSLYRERTQPPQNLPILDAVSSEVLLASNRLAPGERNDNPLDAWVTRERPTPERPLEVDLNGQLRCLGWALTDPDGNPVARVSTGKPYDFRIYWEVTAPISMNWKTFIHLDGGGRRHNGDHDTLQGKYPFKYWQKGDFITDVHRIELPPQFASSSYQVYFGLFSGEKRLSVRSGKHQENRIMGGALVVH